MRYDEKPTLRKDDLEDLIYLLVIFDEISFNMDNEMFAKLVVPMGNLGKFVISYYHRERHVKIYPAASQPCDADLFNGYYGPTDNYGHEPPASRDELIAWAKEKVRESVLGSL